MTVRAGANPKSLAPAPGGSASASEIFQTFEELKNECWRCPRIKPCEFTKFRACIIKIKIVSVIL